MMRVLPAPLRKLQALNWGQALSAADYQRVQLRILCMSMLMTLPALLAVTGYVVANRFGGHTSEILAIVLTGALVGVGALLLAMIVWLCWTILKINVMRWRGLGFKGFGIPVMVLLVWLVQGLVSGATEISQRPELLFMGLVPLWLFKWLGVVVILQIMHALVSYWLYLEETPLRTTEAPLQKPYIMQPGRFEAIALFLQQVWIWFSILSVPMYFIVSII